MFFFNLLDIFKCIMMIIFFFELFFEKATLSWIGDILKILSQIFRSSEEVIVMV